MTCPRCGASVPDGANYCAECGTRFAGPASVVAEAGSAASATTPGTVSRNLMVEVPSNASVLRGTPKLNSKGEQLPKIEVRGGWVDEPTFSDLPVGRLLIKREGMVFVSKGQSGVWPALRSTLAPFAQEELMMHLFGLLGSPLWLPKLKRQEEQAEEEWINKTLADPATVVIPAPLVTGVRLERIKGRTFARTSLDDGRTFSVALADPFLDISRTKLKQTLSEVIMGMRFDYEGFQFFGRYVLAQHPDETQFVADFSQVYFAGGFTVPSTLRQKIGALQASPGLDHGRLFGEPLYHLQRFRGVGQFKDPKVWTALDKLPTDYVPFCYKCSKLTLRPMSKYCTSCGLWMW